MYRTFSEHKTELCFQIVNGQITSNMFTPDLALQLGYDRFKIEKWNFSWVDVINMAQFVVNEYNYAIANNTPS